MGDEAYKADQEREAKLFAENPLYGIIGSQLPAAMTLRVGNPFSKQGAIAGGVNVANGTIQRVLSGKGFDPTLTGIDYAGGAIFSGGKTPFGEMIAQPFSPGTAGDITLPSLFSNARPTGRPFSAEQNPLVGRPAPQQSLRKGKSQEENKPSGTVKTPEQPEASALGTILGQQDQGTGAMTAQPLSNQRRQPQGNWQNIDAPFPWQNVSLDARDTHPMPEGPLYSSFLSTPGSPRAVSPQGLQFLTLLSSLLQQQQNGQTSKGGTPFYP
jgi:hypothetical protein